MKGRFRPHPDPPASRLVFPPSRLPPMTHLDAARRSTFYAGGQPRACTCAVAYPRLRRAARAVDRCSSRTTHSSEAAKLSRPLPVDPGRRRSPRFPRCAARSLVTPDTQTLSPLQRGHPPPGAHAGGFQYFRRTDVEPVVLGDEAYAAYSRAAAMEKTALLRLSRRGCGRDVLGLRLEHGTCRR